MFVHCMCILQVRLGGCIPLVNTSSEDEVELDLRQPGTQHQVFVRGGNNRNSVRRNSDNFLQNLESPIMFRNRQQQTTRMWRSPSSPSLTGSTQGWDSGIGSIRGNIEETMAEEKQRKVDQLASAQKERDIERRNHQLQIEKFKEEREKIEKEIKDLKEKVKLASVEKDNMEEIVKQQIHGSSIVVNENIEKIQVDHREKELMTIVQCLTGRLQDQDQDLADVKEDNIFLRMQIRNLRGSKEKESKSGGLFKIFCGNTESSSGENQYEDPQIIRMKLRQVEKELSNQKGVNNQLRQYVGDVLLSIMVKNPHILENC